MQFSKAAIYPLFIASVVTGCVNPKPIQTVDVADFALTDVTKIYASQEPLTEVLTLSEAMARALKYNLDNRVKLMEQAVAHKSVEMAELDMLPMLGLSAGYLNRSNVDGSSSESLLTHRQSLEPSTSQDRERFNGDLRFTWNVLDFGVSYIQAKQNSDKYLISTKTREKVMLKLLQQVRSAYWRAVVMQKMAKDVDAILTKVDISLNDLKAVREQQLYTPLFALNDIRLLIETKKQLEQLKQSITTANTELATLINEPASTALKLETPANFTNSPVLPDNLKEMELTALMNSTDYVSEMYNVRVDQMETHKALMRLLPGIEFSYAGAYSTNSFLWNNLWGEAGIRLAGDLVKLLTMPDTFEYGEISAQLAEAKRLAVNTAVVAGVHLAWQNYLNSLNTLTQTAYLNDVDAEIAQLTRNAEQNRTGSEVEAIQNEFRAFSSEIGYLLSYAEAQDAFGAFLVSLGSNPVPADYQAYSVKDLSKILQDKNQAWEQGKLEIFDPKDVKAVIMDVNKRRIEERSWLDKLLDKPVYMPEIKKLNLNVKKLDITPQASPLPAKADSKTMPEPEKTPVKK